METTVFAKEHFKLLHGLNVIIIIIKESLLKNHLKNEILFKT